MVENRFVGMKSRGVYEAPGMTLLYAAHRLVEQLTLDRDLMHLRDRLAPEVAEMVYYGFWYHAKLDALMAFIRAGPAAGHRRGALESLQGQHHRRRPQQPQQPVRRRHRHDGRRRLVQPDRRRRLFADSRPARPRAGKDAAEEVLTWTTHRYCEVGKRFIGSRSNLLPPNRLISRRNLRLADDLYAYARQLGRLPGPDPLEGLDVNIRMVKVFRSVHGTP